MVVFTTIEHLKRSGVPRRLRIRHGKDYRIVVIGPEGLEEARHRTGRITAHRVIDTIPSRDHIVAWLREHDGPGTPWPKYVIEGL